MEPIRDTAALRYLDPHSARIAGKACEDMTIRTQAGRALGRLRGFVVDPETRRLRFFVIGTRLLGTLRMIPITAARVDVDDRVIELLGDAQDFEPAARFNPRRFPSFSDEDFLTAIFASPQLR